MTWMMIDEVCLIQHFICPAVQSSIYALMQGSLTMTVTEENPKCDRDLYIYQVQLVKSNLMKKLNFMEC